jgi:hypothetical protein
MFKLAVLALIVVLAVFFHFIPLESKSVKVQCVTDRHYKFRYMSGQLSDFRSFLKGKTDQQLQQQCGTLGQETADFYLW